MSTNARYFFSPTDSRFRMPTGPYTLDELKTIVKDLQSPLKFFDEQGFLKGTVSPNGEVQT